MAPPSGLQTLLTSRSPLTVSQVRGFAAGSQTAYPDPAAIVSELQTWLVQGAWVIALVGRPPYALELTRGARPLQSRHGAIAATPGPKFELPHHAVVVAAADLLVASHNTGQLRRT